MDAANWEGEAGGRGIRALTRSLQYTVQYSTVDSTEAAPGPSLLCRYIYQPPPGDNLTTMSAMLDKMTPFMIVRHPFVRLVSAYEDKMLNPHPFPFAFHHKIQETIKARRTSKNKRISFPRDLLNSARYQHMLYCTVLYCTVM